ncbi:diaminopimelate decarboxylase [Ameyamaea chiangmaiensis NBRC 103196]|uniref:Diaminopimelate decarboxylase n=1 Tax=Ameyamaea chiangmaiensis TaxID=442969 RepID=A0A850PAL0_9PROT|nr:diaminopimelate decarboxylase [Ameyamaea chiangmaiensis]MBS4074439.1 diaminopimelate decarboxylase [Ameyamaea chiangmaiensis]NVN41094.1 diaminopimelate decarboxylase [Ameyamaea chiangmaiensis]GBQ72043.1 diaminopimelate decarboxylase [Ameyamaea chiangmaiensis NBRC 103196]
MDTLPSLTSADPDTRALLAARPALRMNAVDGLLFEGVPLNAIADALGTPTWVMGAGTLRIRVGRLRAAIAASGLPIAIHYAMKANDHLAVLRVLAREGVGADIVSGGELARARAAGIDARHIVFSGVGKSDDELRAALVAGVAQINVESAEELDQLSAIAAGMGVTARVTLRVNPDVDAGTHAKITTGLADNKFGVAWGDAAALYARAAGLPGIEPVGFSTHIGSQILTPAPFRAAYARVADLVRIVRAQGHAVSTVDCGGGLGIAYRDETEGSPEAFIGAIGAELGALDVRLAIEPGRWIAGPAGVLLTSVILRKAPGEGTALPFLVTDAAMNDLARPSLYEAWHGIVPLSPRVALGPLEQAHVVGPVCESGDTFARDRALPIIERGDRLAVLDTGAYGAVMSSTYNARPLAAQAMVDDGRWATIRARQPVEALWDAERQPDWLA